MSYPTINTGHTTQNSGSSVTNHVVNTPSHSEGDVIYIFAGIDHAINMTQPAGFSIAFEDIYIYSNAVTASLWYKTAGASEPSTYTWTSASAERSVSIAWSISNDGGIDVASNPHTGSSSTASCADVTPTVNNTLVLRLVATDGETLPHGIAAGHTQLDGISYFSGATISVQYETHGTAGAVGQILPSLSQSEEWGGGTICIAPADDGIGGGITNYYKAEQLIEQSTTSSGFVDVSGTTLNFTPDDTSQIWMIFASGECRASGTEERPFEMRLVVNGVEKDIWSHQNSNSTSPNGAGFFVFDRITGANTLQTIKVQFRAISGTCYADNIRVIAARVPNGADFQFYQSDGLTSTTGSNVNVGSMAFTPSSMGNYYIFGSIKHREYPGGGTSQAWFEDSVGGLHPNAPSGVHHSCARDPWNPLTSVWRQNLAASLQTYRIRFTSSDSGSNSSQHVYRKMMAFREDAWDNAYYNLSAAQSTTTASTFQTKNSITVPAPPESRDYVSFQCARISGDNSSTAQKSGELRIGGTGMVRTNHRINRAGDASQGYHHIIGLCDARNESGSLTYANGFLSPNAITVNCAESAIVVLRYPGPGYSNIVNTVSSLGKLNGISTSLIALANTV